MTVERLPRVLSTRPLQRFSLQLADRTRVPVPHPDSVLPHPTTGRTVAVADRDGTFRIVDLLLITAIHVGNGRTRRARS
jgi:hypothetical protein